MNRTLINRTLGISVAVVAVAGLSAGAYLNSRRAAGVEITSVSIARGNVVAAIGATGTLEAVNTVQVGSQVSGRVQELFADFNTIVRKNQLLARLDPSLLESEVEQSRAAVVKAEADLDRLRVSLDDAKAKLSRAQTLHGRRLIAAVDLEAAELTYRSADAQVKSSAAQLRQAQASLNQAQVTVQKTVIASPIDGIIVSRDVDVGQTVAASMQAPTLFLIAADLSRMRLNASIDESDVGRIRPGQAVRFRVDAFPEEEFTGTVSQVRLAPTIVQNVVTYETLIDVPNPELKLRPGMTANVTVEVARRDNVLRVANAAIRFRPQTETFAALGQEAPDLKRQSAPSLGAGAAVVRVASQVTDAATKTVAPSTARRPVSAAATVADDLLEEVEIPDTAGRLWVMVGGKLTPLEVRLGLSDGAYTEVTASGLAEGAEVVTAVETAKQATTKTTAPASNPFLGTQPGRPMGGPPVGTRPG